MTQLTIQQALNLAVEHQRAGRLREAENLYRQILAHEPNQVEAMQNLSGIAQQTGRNSLAMDLTQRAIALRPDSAELLSNLGNLLEEAGRFDEAITACCRAIALQPDVPENYINLGLALASAGQFDEAIATYRKAIALRPNFPEAYSSLGNVLIKQKRLDEAIAACRRAIMLRPSLSDAHNNLGIALAANEQLEEAIVAYRQSLALQPDSAAFHNNLGNALKANGQFDDAVAAYHRAIALSPAFAEAHNNLSVVLLTRGEFRQGWEEHEWRWKCRDFPSRRRNFPQAIWNGRRFDDRTLLLHAEQGFGDVLQFIRYVPMVAELGGKVIIECQPELVRLLEGSYSGFQIVACGQPLAGFDLHCPLLSLPLVFGTNLANIPGSVPYVKPDATLIDAWARTLGSSHGQLRIGLAWAGNPGHGQDRTRSMNVHHLAPLLNITSAKFYSLQKGGAEDPLKNLPAELKLIDLTADLKDFADTAAVIQNLDLVISVDTAVAHLAGALAKPVWTLLPWVPDFRWLLERTDTPWYPTMRLYRQKTRRDWEAVVNRMVVDLKSFEPHETDQGDSR